MANVLDAFARHAGKSPMEALFYWSGGPIEVAPGVHFASMFSGVTAFETDDGVVLVDSGLARLGPMLSAMIRQRTRAPIHTAIFTQGHVDHAFGLDAFLAPGQPLPKVVAHRAMPARFARYRRTAGHNRALNARQFGGSVREAEGAMRDDYDTFREPKVPPNVLYDERVDLRVGGLTFEVHHARGETDDHSWIFCPERGVLCPGDLFIWAVPNAGNPQKVQRYAWEWADALRAMAAKEPRSMCPGHGGPVIDDPALVHTMLVETADYLDAIVDATIAAMNDGSPPHVDVVHRVAIPWSDRPWLQPLYDEGEFIVRNVLRYFGGWWSGRPSELKPPPREALAQEWVSLVGGVDKLLERAERLSDEGEARLACALADHAIEACAGDREVGRRVARLYRRRSEGEESLMARNLFLSAAAYAEEGRPFR